MNQKGQSIMIDLLISLVVFILAIFFLFNLYEANKNNIIEQQTLADLQEKASQISDTLVRSPGIPENWEQLNLSDVNVFGLAKSDRKLDEDKVNAFRNFGFNYNELKKKFGLGFYDFLFELNGEENISIGLEPKAEANIVKIKRIVEFKGGEAIVSFSLYKTR